MTVRRTFLQSSAAAAAVALSYQPETAKGYFANDALQVGCIGTGGRCRKLMESLPKLPGVKITAVCDIWDVHRAAGKKLADPQAAELIDYHELLARKDVDAVLIGSPDHWHVPMTVDACAAGKDVYVEKPLTHDLAEGQAVIAAQNQHRRIVQVGMQQRSMPHIVQARELLRAGHIGKVVRVHLSWNRNTPRATANKLGIDPGSVDWKRFVGAARPQPFDEYRFRNWRWFWDFGGGIFTDLMVHWIDVHHWLLGLDFPETAQSQGDFHHAYGVWETPDSVQTLLKYQPVREGRAAAAPYEPSILTFFEGSFSNARNASRIEFHGTDATLFIDRGGYQVLPERKSKTPASELILGEGPRGADFYNQPDGELLHLANWVDCIRSRAKPTAPAEAGVQAAAAAHLANLSLRKQTVAKWSEVKS